MLPLLLLVLLLLSLLLFPLRTITNLFCFIMFCVCCIIARIHNKCQGIGYRKLLLMFKYELLLQQRERIRTYVCVCLDLCRVDKPQRFIFRWNGILPLTCIQSAIHPYIYVSIHRPTTTTTIEILYLLATNKLQLFSYCLCSFITTIRNIWAPNNI